MSRLTYKSKDGSWGLKGLSWEQLVALPPRVYGALAKLKQMEDLVDDVGAADQGQAGVSELALEELLTMGTDGIKINCKMIPGMALIKPPLIQAINVKVLP